MMRSALLDPAPFEGVLRLVIRDLLPRPEGMRGDLGLEFEVKGSNLDPQGYATAPRYNSPLHDAWLRGEKRQDDGCLLWRIEVPLKPDPWVPGGLVAGEIIFQPDRSVAFRGSVFGQSAAATVRMESIPRPRPGLVAASALPTVLQQFEADPLRAELPDFSGAGACSVEIPAGLPEFPVTAYGAIPDSGQDCHAPVQAAIDSAARAGGGVVRFPAGRFDLSVEEKYPGFEIASSNIYILGAGSGHGGTRLVNHRRSDSPDPKVMWRANEFPCFFHAGHVPAKDMGGYGPQPGEVLARARPAERNVREFRVEDGAKLRSNEVVLLRQFEDEEGSLARALIDPSTRLAANYLGQGRPLFQQTLRIVAIEGDLVRIDAPLRWELRPEWRPEINRIATVRRVGIASLRLESCWQGYWEHHRNAEHDNGWDHIRFDGVVDGWVRDVIHDSPTTAVNVNGSKNCTVIENRIVGNPAHNGFTLGGASSDNLFSRCHGGRQMHAFSLQGPVTGNVFSRCEADEPAGIDLHGSIAPANLFDCIRGCVNVGGGSDRNVPPRHGRGLVLWNLEMGRFNPYRPWQAFDEAADWEEMAGFIAVGVRGKYGQPVRIEIPVPILEAEASPADGQGPWGRIEALNRPVLPESLFEWQWQHRKGLDSIEARSSCPP